MLYKYSTLTTLYLNIPKYTVIFCNIPKNNEIYEKIPNYTK